MRSRVLGVYDKGVGKHSILEKEHTLVSKEGEVYSRAWESAVFVGTGGWGGERGEYQHYPLFREVVRGKERC